MGWDGIPQTHGEQGGGRALFWGQRCSDRFGIWWFRAGTHPGQGHCIGSFPGSQGVGSAWQSPVFAPVLSGVPVLPQPSGQPQHCPHGAGTRCPSLCPAFPGLCWDLKISFPRLLARTQIFCFAGLTPRAAHDTNAGKLQAQQGVWTPKT